MHSKQGGLFNQIKTIRKELHRCPEASYEEYQTTRIIKEAVTSWGLDFIPFKNLDTGGYCDIGEGDIYCFRSDIDALPVTENSSHEIISENSGFMHACGHDFHTAAGLGLIKYFMENKQLLKGRLRVIFQPGEEAAPGGAEAVINENIWENVLGILTVHVGLTGRPGQFILSEGAVQASSTSMKIELTGPGGHTSAPFESVDIINVCSYYIAQLQSHLDRKTDARDTLAFAFGSINGGTEHNIIPQSINLRGTIRTHNNDVLLKSLQIIRDFSSAFEKIHGIKINVQFPTSCPPAVNDRQLCRLFIDFMKKSGRENSLIMMDKPSMGADDFSFYLDKAPGLYLIAGGEGRGALHSGDFFLDDSILEPIVINTAEFISFLFQQREPCRNTK